MQIVVVSEVLIGCCTWDVANRSTGTEGGDKSRQHSGGNDNHSKAEEAEMMAELVETPKTVLACRLKTPAKQTNTGLCIYYLLLPEPK